MNDAVSNFVGSGGDGENLAERDVVLTKLLDGRATSEQWRALRAWTERDAVGREEVWNDLIAQSEHGDALTALVGAAGRRAGHVSAETRQVIGVVGGAATRADEAPGRQADTRDRDEGSRSGVRGATDRLGWLVAAVLAVGFVTFALRAGGPSGRGGDFNGGLTETGHVGGGGAQAGLGSGLASGLSAGLATGLATPDDALGEYLRIGQQKGQVLGELPQRVVLQSRELGQGQGKEVLYLRQIVERAVVKDMYKLGTNDAGEAVMVPSPDWATPHVPDYDDQHVF